MNISTLTTGRKHFEARPQLFSLGKDEQATPGDRLRLWIRSHWGDWGGQKACAEDLGIDRSQLVSYLSDRRFPGIEIIRKFAEAGLNVDWWITGRGDMHVVELRPLDEHPLAGIRQMPEQDQELLAKIMEVINEQRERNVK